VTQENIDATELFGGAASGMGSGGLAAATGGFDAGRAGGAAALAGAAGFGGSESRFVRPSVDRFGGARPEAVRFASAFNAGAGGDDGEPSPLDRPHTPIDTFRSGWAGESDRFGPFSTAGIVGSVLLRAAGAP
jgi:hypothetical protein